MKRILLCMISCSLLGLSSLISQNNNNLVVFSETGDRFYLVLNGLKYNEKPETNVKVTNLNATNYKAKILFENGHPDLNHNVYLTWEGNAVTNKEFTYAISRKGDKYKLKFISQADMGGVNSYAQNSVVYNANDNITQQNTNTATNANTGGNTVSTNAGVGGSNSSTTVTTTTSSSTNGQADNVSMNVNVNGLNMNVNVNGAGTGTSTASNNVTTTTTTTSYTTSTSTYGSGTANQQATQTSAATATSQSGGACAFAMSNSSFDELTHSIKAKSFEDAKMKVAKQGISANCVNAAQVRKLMDLFSFEENKLEITKYSYRYTVDKNNYFKVNDGFSFDSSVDALNEYINTAK
ncbi:MAG: DUF4476 domain-containing protein [Bacteroidia bacterium]